MCCVFYFFFLSAIFEKKKKKLNVCRTSLRLPVRHKIVFLSRVSLVFSSNISPTFRRLFRHVLFVFYSIPRFSFYHFIVTENTRHYVLNVKCIHWHDVRTCCDIIIIKKKFFIYDNLNNLVEHVKFPSEQFKIVLIHLIFFVLSRSLPGA